MPLPATAALGNSHCMDFSINPKLISAGGGNILLLDVVKSSGPAGLGPRAVPPAPGSMACLTSAWSSGEAEVLEAHLLAY